MRPLFRHSVTLLAIWAIALHTVLWASIGPLNGQLAIDPFTVICHSGTSGPVEQAPPPIVPAHPCDHCTLCSAIASPPVPDTSLTLRLEPVRVLQVLVGVAPGDDVTADLKLARGPPVFA